MRKTALIIVPEGLHARLAVKIVQTANKHAVEIELEYQDKVIDLKSILGLMSLAIPKGRGFILRSYGEAGQKALEEITQSIEE